VVKLLKARYPGQVADLVAALVSDLAFDKFVRVCDQLAIFWVESRSQTGYSWNMSATYFRPKEVWSWSQTRMNLSKT